MFLIYIIVASKINLFLFMSNKRDSPHKSIFLLTLPEKKLRIIGTRLYTIFKIKTILRKMLMLVIDDISIIN